MTLLQQAEHARIAARRRSGAARPAILVDSRTPVNYEMVAPVVRADGGRPAGAVLVHRERGAAGGWTASTPTRRSRTRRIGPGPGGPGQVGRLPRLRFHVGDAAARHRRAHPDVPRRRREVRVRRADRIDAGVAPAVLRQRAAAAELRAPPAPSIADSPATRLIGMPKVDCLVDGIAATATPSCWRSASIRRGRRCSTRRRGRPLLVSTRMGVELVERARARCRSTSSSSCTTARAICGARYSGGVDWVARLQPLLDAGATRCLAAQRQHHAVPRRRRRDDHRPQFGRLRVPAAAIVRSCASTCPS